MPTTAMVFSLLLAGAGDVDEEQNVARQLVDDWNRQHGQARGARVEVLWWRLDAYPTSGAHPQEIINRQIVDKADIVTAVLWTRFGTPTPAASSGTAEEIERSIASGKPVLVYFSQRPVPPASLDPSQYALIRDFQTKYSGRGLYWSFNDLASFQEQFRAHLAQHMNRLLGQLESHGTVPTSNPLPELSRDEELALGLAVSDPQAGDRGAWKYPLHDDLRARGLSEVEATVALASLVQKNLLAPVDVLRQDEKSGKPTSAPAYRVTSSGLSYAKQKLSTFRPAYTYRIRLVGTEDENSIFLEHLRSLPGIQQQTRFLSEDTPGMSTVGLFTYQPFQESTIRQMGRLFNARIDEVAE